jgi:large subunit ribosomal protein L17
LITLARNSVEGNEIEKVNARRRADARLGGSPEVVKKLFDDIGPRYVNRNGGYTRMFKLGPRLGDAAEMVLLELVEE